MIIEDAMQGDDETTVLFIFSGKPSTRILKSFVGQDFKALAQCAL
jgi:hypothetical protein